MPPKSEDMREATEATKLKRIKLWEKKQNISFPNISEWVAFPMRELSTLSWFRKH